MLDKFVDVVCHTYMKIGIFGGTFDPIHTGHAIVANYIAQWTDLDEVWLMVSPLNPLKQAGDAVDDKHRLAMAKLVAEKCEGVRISDFEHTMPQPSYTYQTLICLKREYPDCEFVLIIGSDNWKIFNRWKNYEEIISEFEIMIYLRPGYQIDIEALPENVSVINEGPQAYISSTMVREAVKNKKNINFIVPPQVYDYIKTFKLYE